MKTRMIAVIAAIVGLTTTIAAQTNQKLTQAQKENKLALMKYEWKSRTEIQKDGETKKDQLVQVSYDRDGNLLQATIASSPEPDLPTRGLRGLIAQNKKKDFMKKLDQLKALAKSYSDLPADKMQRFTSTAKVSTDQKLIRIQGYDVLQAGDSLTMWVDPMSQRQRRIEIMTALDSKPVSIVSEFQDIQGGPTYMARNQVSYGNSLVIITQNFDYTLKSVAQTSACVGSCK
jgi:hypothetical protein